MGFISQLLLETLIDGEKQCGRDSRQQERERSKNEDRWILKTEKQNERDRDEMGDPWGKP